MKLLTQIETAYPDNTIITRNSNVGLQICAEVTAGLTQTPATTTTPGATLVVYCHPHGPVHAHATPAPDRITRRYLKYQEISKQQDVPVHPLSELC